VRCHDDNCENEAEDGGLYCPKHKLTQKRPIRRPPGDGSGCLPFNGGSGWRSSEYRHGGK